MKKIYKSPEEPPELKKFRQSHPHETWTYFHKHKRKGYRQIKSTLIRDQHGLCAYCETAIVLPKVEGQVDDFRVEHFYPKADTEFGKHNYHLDWWNMLGVCHGGSQPDVPDAVERFSTRQIDRSCDVLKGNKKLSGRILNPLKIPMTRIWCFSEYDGTMYVDYRSCPKKLVDRAERTIEELNLNAPRLCRMRKALIERLAEQLTDMVAEGTKIETALETLAVAFLAPDMRGICLPYFSTTRWYLADGAEKLLERYN